MRILGLVALVFLTGCGQKPTTYEFHTGSNGQVIWRCNRYSGEVEWAPLGGKWKTVQTDWDELAKGVRESEHKASTFSFEEARTNR